MRLRDKVAIVTGGASGIGQATAVRFAQEGAGVVVADIDEAQGNQTVAMIAQNGGEALFVRADVSNELDAARITQSTIQNFSQLDILVNDAAVFVLKGFSGTHEEWMRSLSVNVIGTTLCSKYAAAAMEESGGSIVNLGSISSWIAEPDCFIYSATKGAILQLTRNMALDLAQYSIRVNYTAI